MLANYYMRGLHDKLENLIASKPSPTVVAVLIALGSTLGFAILLHRWLLLLFHSSGGGGDTEPTNGGGADGTRRTNNNNNNKTAERSRLVRKQFGSLLPDDLLLREEGESNETQTQTTSTSGCTKEEKDDSTTKSEQSATGSTTTQIPSQPSATKSHPQTTTRTLNTAATTAVARNSRRSSNPPPPPPLERPPFLRHTSDHPGLAAFYQWCDVETSLFRIYTIPRTDGVPDDPTTIPPYNPSSKRGNVPIQLEVTNSTDDQTTISVHWIDYKGKYVPKGRVAPGASWSQRTWIDHPWVFCAVLDDTTKEETTLLHYIPYRVIPTTSEAKTVDDNSGEPIGVHRFRILSPPPSSPYCCAVDDPVLPHPAHTRIRTPHQAAEFALLHCLRMQFADYALLKRYLTKIIQHPSEMAFRQIRTANPNFARIWMSPARGVLLAAGFVEHGAFVELGTDDNADDGAAAAATPFLPSDTVNELSLFVAVIESWEKRSKDFGNIEQPPGADGYGRAGFGL